MNEVSFSDKYVDAFWRVVPVPVLLVADAIAVVLYPSTIAIVAFALVAAVGLAVEITIWRKLARSWSMGVSPSKEPETKRQRRRRTLTALAILMAAFAARALTVASSPVNAVILIVAAALFWGGLVAIDLYKSR